MSALYFQMILERCQAYRINLLGKLKTYNILMTDFTRWYQNFICFYFFRFGYVGSSCCMRAFSSCSEWGYSWLQCSSFSLQWLLLWTRGSRVCGLQYLWLEGSRARAQWLWCTGLVASWHAGSSRTRDQTGLPCIGRWMLNQGVMREAQQ